MELYLLRHGEAAPVDPPRIPRDESRPLTGYGERQIEALAATLASAGVRPDIILTSPLRRAFQTAQIVARSLGAPDPLPQDALRPGCSRDAALGLLREFSHAERILLVGHNPEISQIGIDLTGSDVDLSLAPGGLARIDLNGLPRPRAGTLVWLLPPGGSLPQNL